MKITLENIVSYIARRCRSCNDKDFGRLTIRSSKWNGVVTICEKCGHKEVNFEYVWSAQWVPDESIDPPRKNVTPGAEDDNDNDNKTLRVC
jgi:hypothetical protein